MGPKGNERMKEGYLRYLAMPLETICGSDSILYKKGWVKITGLSFAPPHPHEYYTYNEFLDKFMDDLEFSDYFFNDNLSTPDHFNDNQSQTMITPKFKNVHNTLHHTKNGPIWNSRSCAVVCHIRARLIDDEGYFLHDEPLILIAKRGTAGDSPNMWNVPCGYIDWNENLQEAAVREIWEETGIDLTEYFGDDSYYEGLSQPWFVNTAITENKQNIAMHIHFEIFCKELPKTSLANMEKNEVAEVKWVSMDEFSKMDENEWAFGHYNRIKELTRRLLPNDY